VTAVRRYRFLETIRQFARDRLVESGESEGVPPTPFEFLLAGIPGALADAAPPHQLDLPPAGRLEQDNLPRGLGLALSAPSGHDGAWSRRALFWFWTKRGLYEEGRLWLERAEAAASPANGKLRARAAIGLAHMRHFQCAIRRPRERGAQAGQSRATMDHIRSPCSCRAWRVRARRSRAGDARSNEARVAAGPGEELLIHHSDPC
jgi:non-specific serine/threonine protein kinase